MANGLNKVQLIGYLGADPELRYTQAGKEVANFRMATSESWTGADGVKQERTEWHKIVVFGKLAEICSKYLEKGRQAYVEGKLQTREWEDKDGIKRYTTEIVAMQVLFLGGGDGGSHVGYAGGGHRAPDQPGQNDGNRRAPTAAAPDDDDYPF